MQKKQFLFFVKPKMYYNVRIYGRIFIVTPLKKFFMAFTVPWRTFRILGTFPLHKMFFILEKGSRY